MIFCLLFQLWVADAGMVDGFQLLDEDGLGVGDVAESDGTLLEITLFYLRVDQLVHQFADALLRIVGQ